jgi:sulfatase modifying factor 1
MREANGLRKAASPTPHKVPPWTLVAMCVIAIVGITLWRLAPGRTVDGVVPAPANSTATSSASTATAFAATVPNKTPPPGNAPPGMVWIPGGEFSMGAQDPPDREHDHIGMEATQDSRPVHRVYVDGFWMDQTDVTNAEFARFVDATHYVTEAERTPKAEDFPGTRPEELVAGAVVFSPPDQSVPLTDPLRWWTYVKGANWRHPSGPDSTIQGKDNYPVVDVSYNDAVAYAKWGGKRLPTEAEWEFAARGGLTGKPFVWGDSFRPGGKYMANTFQGHFPNKNSDEDGFSATSPVTQFPPNGYGLYDMAGNVWQWIADWYRADSYRQLGASGTVSRNPTGPDSSFDPAESGVPKRVMRGGSFLCTDQYCSRYMVGTRGKGEASTGTNHLGFRCVKAIPQL